MTASRLLALSAVILQTWAVFSVLRPRREATRPSLLLELKQRRLALQLLRLRSGAASSGAPGTTTTTTYSSIGVGACACSTEISGKTNFVTGPGANEVVDEDTSKLERCKGTVLLKGVFDGGAGRIPSEEDCQRLCTDAEDCMAYQYNQNCHLFLFHQVPTGVLKKEPGGQPFRGPSQHWTASVCNVKSEGARSRFRSRYRVVRDEQTASQLPGFGPCICGSRNGSAQELCRVADEREGMSQEDAERECTARNQKASTTIPAGEGGLENYEGGTPVKLEQRDKGHAGCAGFMAFSSFSTHPKAKTGGVLFFAGNQTVIGAHSAPALLHGDAKDKERALSYLDEPPAPQRTISAFSTMPAVDRARCLVPRPDADLSEIAASIRTLAFRFHLAVAGVAVFSTALVVVAVFLGLTCRKHTRLRMNKEKGANAESRRGPNRPLDDAADPDRAPPPEDYYASEAPARARRRSTSKQGKLGKNATRPPPRTVGARAAASSVRWGVPLSAKHVLNVQDATPTIAVADELDRERPPEGDGAIVQATQVEEEVEEEEATSTWRKTSRRETVLVARLGQNLTINIGGEGEELTSSSGPNSRDGQSVTRATGYEDNTSHLTRSQGLPSETRM